MKTRETTPMWCQHCQTITAHEVNPGTLVDQRSACGTCVGDSHPYIEPLDFDESYDAVPPYHEWAVALGIPAAPYYPDVREAR